MRAGFAVAALLALAALSSPAFAQKSKPNLSGYWDLARKQAPQDAALKAKIAPNTVILNDTGAAELGPGDFGGLKLTAPAREVAQKWKPQDDMTISKACAPPSIIYAMQGPFAMEIEQYSDVILMKLEFFDLIRVIRLNGKHRPDNAPHFKTGDSIGHWEGNTLVVDTTHLEAATVTNNGLYHSDQVHVIERFKLSPDGKSLLSSQEFEDSATMENRGARFISWDKKAGEYIYPYECDPTFGLNYGAAPTP